MTGIGIGKWPTGHANTGPRAKRLKEIVARLKAKRKRRAKR